ncbi:MAG: class I SAM-dependent methyltransferase [Gemmatimonadaceae bacterium]
MSARVDELLLELGSRLRGMNRDIGDAALDTMASFLYLSQYREFHRTVDSLVPVGARVLDWGAGIGHFAFVQSRLGRQVSAYSPRPTMYNCYNQVLEALGSAGGFDVRVGDDPVRLPFADDSFDCVVSCGVLEHVREFGGDDLGSLREIRRILAPGGVFVCLHLPNRYSWVEYVNRRIGAHHHTFTYSYRDITRLLGESELRLVSHRRYGVLPKLRLARRLKSAADNLPFVHAYFAFDAILDRVGGLVAQNHCFVAARTGRP